MKTDSRDMQKRQTNRETEQKARSKTKLSEKIHRFLSEQSANNVDKSERGLYIVCIFMGSQNTKEISLSHSFQLLQSICNAKTPGSKKRGRARGGGEGGAGEEDIKTEMIFPLDVSHV